ncbi:MAG: PD-(D/E)XK nuclease family protein [Desulfobacterales bacterium]|nr:PD-(D/E)XK nuclease family protein [Desulfobacterales bacterium]
MKRARLSGIKVRRMSIDDLPEPIKQRILGKVTRDFKRRHNEVYLTELLYCLRKAYFSRKIGKKITLQHAWYLYRGTLFDEEWTPLFERRQIRCTHRVPDSPVVVVARADFIDDDGAIADLKTYASLRYLKGPKAEHVKQVLFYSWTNAIDKIRLYYVDFKDCKKFDETNSPLMKVTDTAQRELVKEIEGRAKILYYGLESDTPPSKEESWICKSCEYKEECEAA